MHDKDILLLWWELYHSPEINQLVRAGLANNPSLEAASASLEDQITATKELIRAQQGVYTVLNNQYRLGGVSYINLLNAQQQCFLAIFNPK